MDLFLSAISLTCPILCHVLPNILPCRDSNFLRKDQMIIPRNERNVNLKMVRISYFISIFIVCRKKMYFHTS